MIFERCLHLVGALLAVTLVRGLAVFLAAFAVMSLVKRLGSETRHVIWLGVITSFVLIPLAWLALPAVRIGAGILLEPAAPYRLAAAPALSRADYELLIQRAREQASLVPQLEVPLLRRVTLALVSTWSLGVVFLGVRMLLGRGRLRRLLAGSSRDARFQILADGLAGQLAVRRRIPVLLSPLCRIPFACGILRPRILLPQEAACWPSGRLHSALTHELAHIRRRDLTAQTVGYAVCVLFWFVPPLWLAYAAMLREAETCCDQQVINRGFRGPEYARDIVELARNCEGRILLPSISSVLRGKNGLKERVRKVLSLKPGGSAFGTRAVVRVLAICLVCAAPILALTAQARPLLLQRTDPLFGTWVNSAYEGNVCGVAAKSVFFADGSTFDYYKISDSKPFSAGNCAFESVWIDEEGNHWYRIGWVGDDFPRPLKEPRFKLHVLARVNAAGNWLDTIAGQYRYSENFKDVVCGVPLQYQRQ